MATSAESSVASLGRSEQTSVSGVELEVWEGGAGPTLLFLHPGDGFDPDASYVRALCAKYHVIAPSHPGFGRSALPRSITSVDDIAYLYLDFLQQRGLSAVTLAGASFGGWIAAEIAIKSTERLAAVCLIDPVGAKFEGPMVREIHDLFSYPQYEQAQWLFHDERRRRPGYAHLPDDLAERMARNHESFALFGWSPTLHDPRLAQWLHRIDVPVLLVWGAQDRVVPPEYGRKWLARLPDARMEVVEQAGHYAHVEQPAAVVAAIDRFTASLKK